MAGKTHKVQPKMNRRSEMLYQAEQLGNGVATPVAKWIAQQLEPVL